MPPPSVASAYGPDYYRGRTASNYQDYDQRQGQRLFWLPLLWTFRWITRRYPRTTLAHLDAGCAFGYFVSFVRPLTARSVGVDISPYAVSRAHARFPELEFRVADICALPFRDAAFNVVTSFDTIEHVPDVDRALRELFRVLASGGTLFVRMPYAGFTRRCFGWNDHDPTHVSVLSRAAWRRSFESAGFQIERSVRYPTIRGGELILVSRKSPATNKASI